MIFRPKQKSLLTFINKYRIKGYLVFKTAKSTWMSKFLPKGFGHVFAVIEHDGYNVLIDSTVSHSMAHVYLDEFTCTPEKGDTVVKFDRVINTKINNFDISLMSCVGVVKRFIGLNNFWVFTPKQLYRSMT